jgi:phage-related protein
MTTLAKLLQRSSLGKCFSQLFNEKQCHWAFTFKHKGKDVKVWRLWLGGVVRVFFCYGTEKRIFVAWALQKREDKLTAGEKSELETLFKRLLTAQEANEIKCI